MRRLNFGNIERKLGFDAEKRFPTTIRTPEISAYASCESTFFRPRPFELCSSVELAVRVCCVCLSYWYSVGVARRRGSVTTRRWSGGVEGRRALHRVEYNEPLTEARKVN